MIESVSQIDSKITTYCHLMQLIKNQLAPSKLAARANKEIALVGIFCEIELCNSNGFFIPPAFFSFVSPASTPHKRLTLIN